MTLKQVMDAYPSVDTIYTTIILTIMAICIILYTFYLFIVKPYREKRARQLGKVFDKKSEIDSALGMYEKFLVGLGFILSIGIVYILYAVPQPNPIEVWTTDYLQPYVETNVDSTKVAFPNNGITVIKDPNVKGKARLIIKDTKPNKEDYLPYREESFVSEPHFEQYVYEKKLLDFLKDKGLDESRLLPDKVIILPKGYFNGTSN